MGQKTTILNSELAVKILSSIASRTDGNYSTNLADELDKSQPSISRILTELHNIGFIDKGRREKAQYYNINYDEMSSFWLDQIQQKLEEEGLESEIEEIDQHSEKIKELASTFFRESLENTHITDMTVSKFLFDGFVYSLGYSMVERKDFLEKNSFLKPVLEGLRIYAREKEFCEEICRAMDRSVEEILE